MNSPKIELPNTGLILPGHLLNEDGTIKAEKKQIDNRGPMLSHRLLLQRNRAEVRRYLRLVRKLLKRKDYYVTDMAIMHEENQGCCYQQRWSDTNKCLLDELRQKGKFE